MKHDNRHAVDVVVIGGGHAGTEAAHAAARRGARVVLIMLDRSALGAMSCNPSIGGVGKGHIVREVDAFDGVMARAADAAAIHYRMLNASKGSAIRGPRIQADRRLYARAVTTMLQSAEVDVIEGEAVDIVVRNGGISAVELADGSQLPTKTVVVATGTFLGARIFRGEHREDGGRIGERAAGRLADTLRDLGLSIGRLKTGTPPRLDGRSIDWARLTEQPSDNIQWTMSPLTKRRLHPQIACALTRTTPATHDIIRSAMDRSPLRTGAIQGGGPRYCPSIEDKIERFGDRDGHQVFLEPEGLTTSLVYPNGLSTSLPQDIQSAMIRTIPGLESARIATPGYAVEYGHVDPRVLDHRLALPEVAGLFFAGQINGTTGYEEAAGQGLVAGLNAAAHAHALAPVTLDRTSSYLGVMIDDLVLQGITEPYRMLTARAEYRLTLRVDNAETRLSDVARTAGCLSPKRLAHLDRRQHTQALATDELERRWSPSQLADRGTSINRIGPSRSGRDWLRHAEVDPGLLVSDAADDAVAELIEDARYAPYLDRQAFEIRALRGAETALLPRDLNFAEICGLSGEMIERLHNARPSSLSAASRVRGVTPAALSAIMLHMAKRSVAA